MVVEESERLAKEYGGVLERTKKHRVWRFPDGRIFVMPRTPLWAILMHLFPFADF
jgi:hypothetical protein